MYRRMLLLTSVALLVAVAGCRHRCHKKDDCCGAGSGTLPPAPRGPMLLPPAGLPTTPSVLPPGSSGFLPPGAAPRRGPVPKCCSRTRCRAARRRGPRNRACSAAPVKPASAEPPKAPVAGMAAYTKVKDGLYAGGKPALEGFDALKAAGFRTVIYLHAAGADVGAVKEMASTRDLNFVGIETTPENLADASKEFDRVAGDRLTRPAYVFADDAPRAGAVWYLHFRTAGEGDDVARLRAKALGLSEAGDEGKLFTVAIQKVLAGK